MSYSLIFVKKKRLPGENFKDVQMDVQKGQTALIVVLTKIESEQQK